MDGNVGGEIVEQFTGGVGRLIADARAPAAKALVLFESNHWLLQTRHIHIHPSSSAEQLEGVCKTVQGGGKRTQVHAQGQLGHK